MFVYFVVFVEGGSMADRITASVLYMIAVDCTPLSIVENDGFKQLMKTTVPLYNLPSRTTITRLMDAKYEALRAKVQLALQEVTSFTITCDNWTDVSNQSYMGITIHYATTDGGLKNGCLGVTPLYETHTAEYLSQTLLSVLDSFGLQQGNATAVVSDNGANVKKAIYDSFGRSKHLPCFAHVLSHLVPDALASESMAKVQKIITKVRNIVVLVKRSVVASDELKRLQIRDEKTNSTALKFIRDVPTRWNSTLYMLERFLALEEYVYPVTLCRNLPEMLTRDEIHILKNLCCLLKPIENVIREISGDAYPTSSLIIPLIHCLRIAIESWEPKETEGSESVATISLDFKRKLLAAMNRRFQDQELNLILAISTILDPRFKKIHFENRLAASTAVMKIDNLIKCNDDSGRPDAVPVATYQTQESNIWGFHDQFVANNIGSISNNNGSLHLELQQYLHQPVISRCENPLKYWQILKPAFPSLYKLSNKFLSVVATSVPSERLFSRAGAIKVENRSRISGEHLNKLLFLSCLSREEWGV